LKALSPISGYMDDNAEIFEEVIKRLGGGEDVTLAMVVRAKGPTPGKEGFKMLILKNSIRGSIGGGEVEKLVIEKGKALKRGESVLCKFDLGDIGMSCGGSMSIFLEKISCGDELYIFGAGNIAFHLSKIVADIGFKPMVFDYREGVKVKNAQIMEFQELLAMIPTLTLEKTYVVVATDSHEKDAEIAAVVARDMPAYLGVIGSDVTAGELRDYLIEKGIPARDVDMIHCPIGLVKARTPAEIAVSIAAELICKRGEKSKTR